MLYELLYTSAAVQEMNPRDLLLLLKQARANNTRLQVTGLLVYHNREFLQLIEGEKERVLSVWNKLQYDDRHMSVRVIYEGPVEERGFARWSMGFRDLGAADGEEVEGFSHFLDQGFTSEVVSEDPSIARDLIAFIKDLLV